MTAGPTTLEKPHRYSYRTPLFPNARFQDLLLGTHIKHIDQNPGKNLKTRARSGAHSASPTNKIARSPQACPFPSLRQDWLLLSPSSVITITFS